MIENLVIDAAGDVELKVMAGGKEVARANPMRVAESAPMRRYWADLHGQSGETIGMGSAEAYFRYARDAPSSTWSATRATISRSPMRSGRS